MPWIQRWVDAPKKPQLPVLAELPAGVHEFADYMRIGMWLREAHGVTAEGYQQYHHCPKCNGWIPGTYNEYEVDNLRPHQLAGRRGTEYYCRRCGYQVDFVGMMS